MDHSLIIKRKSATTHDASWIKNVHSAHNIVTKCRYITCFEWRTLLKVPPSEKVPELSISIARILVFVSAYLLDKLIFILFSNFRSKDIFYVHTDQGIDDPNVSLHWRMLLVQ